MQFTYNSYISLLKKIEKYNYEFAFYHNWQNLKKCVILRHDIDYDVEKAYYMAQIEADQNVASTYFVLVTSDFYNVFSKENTKILKSICALGHQVGLHFDEMVYPDEEGKTEKIVEKIIKEVKLLEQIVERSVTTVSMHRPSQAILGADLRIPGIVNSYGKTFFHDFKYISDSRKTWRESIEENIEEKDLPYIHLLTHPFWYHDKQQSIQDDIYEFVNQGNIIRYKILDSNFTKLSDVMKEKDVLTIGRGI